MFSPSLAAPQTLTSHELKQEALTLAANRDAGGLTQLLRQTGDYQLARSIAQTITAQLGSPNIPEAKVAIQRMVELKHHDILKQAESSGLTCQEEIKTFARESLANHAFFKSEAPQILSNLESLLTTLSDASPEEINHQHFEELRKHTALNPVETIPTDNARFRDIQSPAHSNVPLRTVNPETGDIEAQQGKIHANYIPLSGRTGAIATQYPKNTEQAKGDFWQMTLQQKTKVVLDLTQVGERSIVAYYPEKLGETQTFGDIQVTLTRQQGPIAMYEVVDNSTGEKGTVSRCHYQDWVDKTAIEVSQLSNLAAFVAGGNDVCIHCKAGVGRTVTTFAAAELLIKMRAGEITDENIDQIVDGTIKSMRNARGPYAVQTESQRASLVNLVQHWLQNGHP